MADPTPIPAPHEHPETAVQTDPTTDRHDTAVLPDDRGTATWDAAPVAKPATGPATRRSPDLVALVAGVVFCLIAVLGLTGTALPGWVFGGGLVAVVLVVVGVGLLVAELRRSRT